MTELYLIRHGETEWNRIGRLQGTEDIPLNDTGRTQAQTLAGIFAGIGLDAVTASPLSRARETAQIIAAAAGIGDVPVFPGLSERDYGKASGMTLDEKRRTYVDNVVPGQEAPEAVFKRAISAVNEIADIYSGKRVAVVSHGGLINTLLFFLSNGRYGPGKTVLKNCSVTKVLYEAGAFDFAYVNVEAHEIPAHEGLAVDLA